MKQYRKHTRILLDLAAEIKSTDGTVYRGRTKNISFGGVFFKKSRLTALKQDEKCNFSIILSEGTEGLSIEFDSEVVHIRKTGVGLRFASIKGTDAYHHFKNLMVMNSPDPDKLLEELELHPGIILHNN